MTTMEIPSSPFVGLIIHGVIRPFRMRSYGWRIGGLWG